jgi:hypothetical protein
LISIVNLFYAGHDVELLVLNPASGRVHSDSAGMIRLKRASLPAPSVAARPPYGFSANFMVIF